MNIAVGETTPSIKEALAAKPDGILETIAAQCAVSLAQVLDELPEGHARRVAGSRFEELWQDLTRWGEILLIVHTNDIVLECRGALPPGTTAHGYFNIHDDGPIGGHIKADRCRTVYIVDRPFHGRRSCSIQFINGDGEAMFKVFVPRDEKRELVAGTLARFEALRARMC